MSEETWQRLLKVFLERAKDKMLRVRVQSVYGLSKLQDADDRNCPAVTGIKKTTSFETLQFLEKL